MTRLISMVFIMGVVLTSIHAQAGEYVFEQSFNKGRFFMPTVEELTQVNKAYQMELSGYTGNDLWPDLSMQRVTQNNLVYLQEPTDQQTGRGVFALRQEQHVQPWLLQAPHAKSDLYTGKIVAQMFSEIKFKAAMWNSVPRKTLIEETLGNNLADMAHLSNTYWQAVTAGFAQYYPQGKIIQIHGFSQSKRRTQEARNSDIIISSGHKSPPFWVQKYAECLKKSLPVRVSLYPYDVKELGATTNVQGHLLQSLGFDGFLHIELTKEMRQNLLHKKSLRQALFSCMK